MRPNYNFNRLLEKAKKKGAPPSEGMKISEVVSLSLQTKKKEVKNEDG